MRFASAPTRCVIDSVHHPKPRVVTLLELVSCLVTVSEPNGGDMIPAFVPVKNEISLSPRTDPCSEWYAEPDHGGHGHAKEASFDLPVVRNLSQDLVQGSGRGHDDERS